MIIFLTPYLLTNGRIKVNCPNDYQLFHYTLTYKQIRDAKITSYLVNLLLVFLNWHVLNWGNRKDRLCSGMINWRNWRTGSCSRYFCHWNKLPTTLISHDTDYVDNWSQVLVLSSGTKKSCMKSDANISLRRHFFLNESGTNISAKLKQKEIEIRR